MEMFLLQVCVTLLLTAVICYGEPTSKYGPPSNGYSTTPYNDNYNNYNEHDHNEPKSYEFGYAVKDDYTGNDYKRRETSDGNQVNGEYRVQLPDGRTQIVTYYADWQTGFHADVRYEGTASYPDQYSSPYQAAYTPPSNQYGPSNYQNNHGSNQFSGGYQGNNAPAPTNFGAATSSVTIKDYSGQGTPYNTQTAGYNNGYHASGDSDGSYNSGYNNNNGNYGSRSKPSSQYGAP